MATTAGEATRRLIGFYSRLLHDEISPNLFSQLKNGGILVAPMKKDGKQFIAKFRKDESGNLEKEFLDECLFVPLLEGRE